MPDEKKAKTYKELLQDTGRTAVAIGIVFAFVLVVYELSQLMEKLDVSKVDPTQLLTVLLTAVTTTTSMVVAFYFGSKGKD